jgi:uncharacterized protein YjbI with pentapeptide repeats
MDLRGANLARGDLARTDFRGADLRGAILRNSRLVGVDFSEANLQSADLSSARLDGANFSWAKVDDTDFSDAIAYHTVFARLDLRKAKGLAAMRHSGPSTIGVDTLVLSQGNVPEPFLRGCGMPEEFIAFAHTLAKKPPEYNSCFISYSSLDQYFVEHLYRDLQNHGVRCWLATHDLPIGAKIREGIEEAIQINDLLLLVLSNNSVESTWVEKEVETAFDKENLLKAVVLLPVTIDDAVFQSQKPWIKDVKRTRNIGDFRKWAESFEYSRAMSRLLEALKSAPSVKP